MMESEKNFKELFPLEYELGMPLLSIRAVNLLQMAGIDTLYKLSTVQASTLLAFPNVGKKTVLDLFDYFNLYMARAIAYGNKEYKFIMEQAEPQTKERAMTLQEIHEAIMTMIPEARVVKVVHSYINNACGESWDCQVYGDGEFSLTLFMIHSAKDPIDLLEKTEAEYKRLDISKKHREEIAKLKARLALLEMN